MKQSTEPVFAITWLNVICWFQAAVSAPQAYPNAQYGYSYQNQGAVPGAPAPTSGYPGYTGYSAYSAQPGAPE